MWWSILCFNFCAVFCRSLFSLFLLACHNIAEILQKLVLNTNISINLCFGHCIVSFLRIWYWVFYSQLDDCIFIKIIEQHVCFPKINVWNMHSRKRTTFVTLKITKNLWKSPRFSFNLPLGLPKESKDVLFFLKCGQSWCSKS